MNWGEAGWRALEAARAFVGATAPNPPVGAVALSADGAVLGVGAHRAAGRPHAEVEALAAARAAGAERVEAVFVTLEPCNHHGRTPPCTAALVAAGVRRVAVGARDLNGRVAGGGIEALRSAGVEVELLAEHPDPGLRLLAARCGALIGPYAHWLATGRPWVVVKQVLDAAGRMEPPPGRTTFAEPALLEYAHRLRRESDAVLTGSGTVLADRAAFTVRHGLDPRAKPRALLIADRRGRVDAAYLDAARARGLEPRVVADVGAAIAALGAEGAHQLLVEAGPRLTGAILQAGLWDRHVLIRQRGESDAEVRDTRH